MNSNAIGVSIATFKEPIEAELCELVLSSHVLNFLPLVD
jgi:hypothetical protein